MSDFDNDAMLNELLDAIRKPSREDFPKPNLTVREYAQLKGITEPAAYYALESSVDSGKVEKAVVKIDRRNFNIYWKANSR